tara:strand:+ start:988 stop:1161 length:174 start_codon:yes stop_codon:yes gene_type:complete
MTINWPVFLIDIESQLWKAGRITHVWVSERYAAEQHETEQQPKPPILTKEKKEKTQK